MPNPIGELVDGAVKCVPDETVDVVAAGVGGSGAAAVQCPEAALAMIANFPRLIHALEGRACCR